MSSGSSTRDTTDDPPAKAPGRLRRALDRWAADQSVSDARELQDDVVSAGATAVVRCTRGEPVCVAGTVRAVVLRPRAGVPTLEAEVYDGSGTITLVWLGRRRIGGVDPGRALVARGRMTHHEGRPAIYNPSYELRPSSG